MPIVDSPEFGHTFVPIDSLTSSPRSSTVSTSVLEWNSNSGSEGFSVRSSDNELYVRSSPATPDMPTFSPNSPSQTTSLPDDDQTFASFNSAAPVADSVTDTVTNNDAFAYHNLLSALDERLTLQDSVAQWQNHSYRETAGLDNRPDSPSDLLDDGVHDKPLISSVPSPNRSLATESSVSAVTAKPSLHVSSLFLPPNPPAIALPAPPVYSASPSMLSNQTQSESISIAQYFQLKAANAEEAVPAPPQVDGPTRPLSATSCLSYTSSVQTPVADPLPDRSAESPLLTTWQELISKADKSSNSTTAYSPTTIAPRCPSGYSSWYRPLSRSMTPQMESNNTSCQFNPFISGKVTPPSSQGSDTRECNLKSHSPSGLARPMPPTILSQFEPASFRPFKPLMHPPPIIDRPQPCAKATCPFNGKMSGKPINHPVPPISRGQSSPIPIINWKGSDLPRPSPWGWSNEYRLRDVGRGLVSPESTDSVLPPPPSTPSVSSPTRHGSPESPISAIPPSPPRIELQPPYLRHPTPSNAPYVPLTPAPPLNGAYSTQRTSRALPIPTQAPPYTPRYTDSTLPRDMHLSAAPPTPWGPTPRRLRFAPLPPTPSAGQHYTSGPPPPTQPYATPLYTAPLPPYPLYPMPYPYNNTQAAAPQTPAPISTPYTPWRSAPTNNSPLWTPHHVFWYSDGSLVFRVCHFIVFRPLKNCLSLFL